jgi:hypothetical protein
MIKPLDPPPTVTPRAARHAKSCLDTALGHFRQGDKPRAVDYLGQALNLNPALRRKRYVENFITLLLDLPVEEAIPLLADPDRRAALIEKMGGKARLKATVDAPDANRATWINVWRDLAVYGLITMLAVIVMVGVTFDRALGEFEDTLTAVPARENSWLAASDVDSLQNVRLTVLIPAAMALGLGSIVALVIFGAGVHVAATRFLAANGTLVYLLWKITRLHVWMALTGYAAAFVLLLIIPGAPPTTIILFWCTLTAGIVTAAFLIVALVGHVYAFGLGNGCQAAFLGGIIVGALAGGAGWLLLVAAQ